MIRPDTSYASACLMLASIRIREGDFSGAREILDDRLGADAPFGCIFAARIVEEALADAEKHVEEIAA